jgi:hypothetical protein
VLPFNPEQQRTAVRSLVHAWPSSAPLEVQIELKEQEAGGLVHTSLREPAISLEMKDKALANSSYHTKAAQVCTS